MNPQLLVLAAMGVGAMWALFRWRLALKLALLLLVLEGAIRKWGVPGAQQLVYFGKDALLLGCYAGCALRVPGLLRRVPTSAALNAALLVAGFYGLLQVFNPELPSVLVGLFGFKAYFLYVPLLLVVPAAFRSDRELWRFLRRYALLAVPVGLLAAYQFRSPAASVVNTYAWDAASGSAITFGSSSAVRVTGTFSFITGYATYTLVSAFLLLALLAAVRFRLRGNWPLFAALGITFAGMLMSGSRGPVTTLLVVLPLYVYVAVLRAPGAAAMTGRMLVLAALAGAFVNQAFAPAAEAFFLRARTASDAPARIASPFTDPLRAASVGRMTGLGIGSTHQASTHLVGESTSVSPLAPPSFEGESGRVVVELGLIGFLLIYLPRIMLVVIAWRLALAMRTQFHRALAAACLMVMVTSLPSGIVFNVTAGVYYWFFAGLLMLLVRLDRQVVEAEVPGDRRRAASTQRSAGTNLHRTDVVV